MTAPLTVLQVTDTHLRPEPGSTLLGVDTAGSLSAVLEQALAHRKPDAIIASGDLAHDPEVETYRRFESLLAAAFDGPVLYLPGNHDLTGPLQAVLGDAGSLGLGTWEIIGFDSHADHRTESRFDGPDRRALAARIDASTAEHVLLACHHHPLPVGCPWLDKDCIPRGREVVESCAAPSRDTEAPSRVRGLVFGHVHQEVQADVGGIRVLGTPSTCFQFQPHSQRFAIDRSEATGRPGCRWLMLHPDGTLGAEVERVSGYRLNIDLTEVS